MMFSNGTWITRFRKHSDNWAIDKAHLVETTVNDNSITRCGRTFVEKNAEGERLDFLTGNEVAEARHKLLLCKSCDGKQ